MVFTTLSVRPRPDTLPFQQKLPDVLAEANGLQACRALVPQLDKVYSAFQDRLRSGQVGLDALAFTSSLSKESDKYVHDTYSSIAAQRLAALVIPSMRTKRFSMSSPWLKDKVKDWRVMLLVLAMQHGEYDPLSIWNCCKRAYDTITVGIVPSREKAKPLKRRALLNTSRCQQILFPFLQRETPSSACGGR